MVPDAREKIFLAPSANVISGVLQLMHLDLVGAGYEYTMRVDINCRMEIKCPK